MKNTYYAVITYFDSLVKSLEVFNSEAKAIGFAQTKYGHGDEALDDVVVFEFNIPEGIGIPIYYVKMQDYDYNMNEKNTEGEFDSDMYTPVTNYESIPATKFDIVNAEKIYGIDIIPSLRRRRNIQKGSIVKVSVTTGDSYEKCLLQITKIKKTKKHNIYYGKLLDSPQTFIPPSNMVIKFSTENIFDIIQ